MTSLAAETTVRPDSAELERYRVELTAHCYRMLGSAFEAQDALQETLLRAWRKLDDFEQRSSLRTWLYRIATNVCLDHLKGRQRRARPVDMGPASTQGVALPTPLPETAFVEPMPDRSILPEDGDPADVAVARESVRLAFVAALQHLPPRQRAVLILREVLRWKAAEVAELLDTSVASVNSALQRARATLAQLDLSRSPDPMDAEQQAMLTRYVAAFEAYDLDALTTLLHEDVTLSMPPYDLWFRGHDDVRWWLEGPGAECRGSRVLPAGTANGMPAFGQYRASGPNGEHEPWALQVLEISDGRIVSLVSFLDTARLFPLFGLPASPDR